MDLVASKILTKNDNYLTVNILPSVGMAINRKEDLADFVRRILDEKRLTTQMVADRSGGEITRGYVSQIKNRHSINVTPKKLRALAIGLEVSPKVLFEVARGHKVEDDEEFLGTRLGIINKKLQSLGKQDKAKVEVLIDSLESLVDRLLMHKPMLSNKTTELQAIPVNNFLQDEKARGKGRKEA